MNVSKLDAARSQLLTAIRLYFADADPVSTHTLAAAALEILRDLDDHGPKTGTIFDRLDRYVLPEHIETVRKAFRDPQGFFKHADRNPDGILEYYPSHALALLWCAAEKYIELAKETPLEAAAVQWWITIHEPEILWPPYREQVKGFGLDKDFPPERRPDFFNVFSAAYTRSGG